MELFRRAPKGRRLVLELQRSHQVVLGILALVLVLTFISGGFLISNQARVNASVEAVRQARLAHEAMLNQETGLRGYLATGAEQFLDPYHAGRIASQGATRQLIEQVMQLADGPGVAVDRLVRSIWAREAWEAWAADVARKRFTPAQRATGDLEATLLEGKQLFDKYRSADKAFTGEVVRMRDDALVAQRRALLGAVASQTAVLIAGAAAMVRRRRDLEQHIVRPVTDLLATLDSLRTGDLSARAPRSGVAELDAVGEELGHLAGDVAQGREEAARREARLALLAQRLQAVVQVARETAGSLSERYIAEHVVRAASELLDAEAILWLRSDDDGTFHPARRSSDPHGVVPPATLEARDLVGRAAAEARCEQDELGIAFPLVLAGRVVGVLEAVAKDVDNDAIDVLQALSSSTAVALESARLHSQTRALAELDPLTKLPNRRRLEQDLEREVKRCLRYKRPLTFAMIDLDRFKNLNDTFGHPVGDQVLHRVGEVLTGTLRATDTAYRYGGEELAVLFRETDASEGALVAERMREAVSRVSPPGTNIRLTASIGVAELVPTMSPTDLVSLADQALYIAKQEGRNRVVAAPNSGDILTGASDPGDNVTH